MRIVTFNNLGTGHLFNEEKDRTACGKTWPGALGEVEIHEPQGPDHARGRHVVSHVLDGKLHLCGNCEKVIASAGSTMYWRFVK